MDSSSVNVIEVHARDADSELAAQVEKMATWLRANTAHALRAGEKCYIQAVFLDMQPQGHDGEGVAGLFLVRVAETTASDAEDRVLVVEASMLEATRARATAHAGRLHDLDCSFPALAVVGSRALGPVFVAALESITSLTPQQARRLSSAGVAAFFHTSN